MKASEALAWLEANGWTVFVWQSQYVNRGMWQGLANTSGRECVCAHDFRHKHRAIIELARWVQKQTP